MRTASFEQATPGATRRDDNHDVDRRVGRPKGSEAVSQEPLRVDLAREQQLHAPGRFAGGADSAFYLRHRQPGATQERIASSGELDSSSRSREQFHADDDLELLELGAEDLLREVQARRGSLKFSSSASTTAEDVEVIFNNGDMTMRGRDVVRDGLAEFWQSFGTLDHDELNIYGTDRNFVHEALNRYTTLDGRKVIVRAVAWIDRNDQGEVTSLRVYNDQSPLWAQPKESTAPEHLDTSLSR